MKTKVEVVNKTKKYKINKKAVKDTVDFVVQKFANVQAVYIDVAFVGKKSIKN